MEKKTNLKELSRKARIEYIWDYYKWYILAAIIAVAVLFSLIRHFVTYREPILNVIMFNCTDNLNTDDAAFDEFLTAYGYNPKESPVGLSSTLQISETENGIPYGDAQVLSVMIAAGGQDILFGNGQTYLDYAAEGALLDLSTVLSDDLLERYANQLLYTTDEEHTTPYPCAIELTDNEWLNEHYYSDTCYFGILWQVDHLDTAKQFAEFLLDN